MNTVTDRPIPANIDRHDDEHLERVYRAVLAVFEIDETPWVYPSLDAELLPPGSPRLPCSCGCGSSLVRIDEAARGYCLGCPSPEERAAGQEEEDRTRREECRLHADEDAWWAGYTVGEEMIDADPPTGMSGHQRRAFRDGYEAGRREAEAEMAEWADRYDAQTLAMMMADEDIESRYHDAELASANISRKAV